MRETNAPKRTVKSCGPDAPVAGVSSQVAKSVFAKTVTSKPGLAGESTKQTVKPSRRESRIAPVTPVVLPPVLFVARDPWVQSAPGFPCALCSQSGETKGKTRTQSAPRECRHTSWLFDILNRAPSAPSSARAGRMLRAARPPDAWRPGWRIRLPRHIVTNQGRCSRSFIVRSCASGHRQRCVAGQGHRCGGGFG